MQNLEIEGLNSIQTSPVGPATPDRLIERRVQQEMKREGMPIPESQPPTAGAAGFSDVFRRSLDQVNQYQVEADHAVKELVAGRSKNIHETMLAIERADVSLKLMMQVRNKIIDAYKEIMRMQV